MKLNPISCCGNSHHVNFTPNFLWFFILKRRLSLQECIPRLSLGTRETRDKILLSGS